MSCGLDQGFEDLGTELFAPDIGYIESPGRKIASGSYHRFSVRAPTLEDRYIAAFEDSELVVIRFEEDGEKCVVGPARSFGTSTTNQLSSDHEPLMPYLATRDDSGRGELRFTNFACDTLPLSVPDVPLPRDTLTGDNQSHLIVRNGSRELLAVDPWGEQAVTLGTDVSYFRTKGQRLWSVEQGALVLRDAGLRELGRVGTAITEVAVSRSSTDSWAAYVDEGSVYLVTEADFAAPLRIMDDSCHVAHAGYTHEQVLAFHSPCAARHLMLYDGDRAELIDYVDDVIAATAVVRNGSGFDVNYWTGPDGGTGSLWIALAGEEPQLVFENALIRPTSLFRTWAFGLSDWNGTSGTYQAWRAGELTTIATEVAELNELGIVANYQDGSGDLLEVLSDDSTRRIGSRVPLEGTRGLAFVGNSSGSRGDLFVVEGSGEGPRKIASGVTARAFLFSVQVETLLMFLSDYDDQNNTATLQVRLIDTGDQFEVSSDVTEIVEVGFPRPGILYNVVEGSRQGLWFAGVR